MSVQIVQNIHKHAPGDKRSYGLDFADELNGQTIDAAVWTATGLTKSLEEVVGTLCQLYLAGGTDGADYVASCQITTSTGEILTRSILLECRKL
jgi:hypothetical protein